MDVLDLAGSDRSANSDNKGLKTTRSVRSRKHDFIFDDDLHAHLCYTAASRGLATPVLLLTVFQELLRRYTNQASVTVGVYEGSENLYIATLADNVPIRAAVQRVQRRAEARDTTYSLAGYVDGQFSFNRACDPPDVGDEQAIASPVHWWFHCSESSLGGFIEFEPKSWNPGVVESLSASYQSLLRVALNNLDTPIGELDIVSNSEMEILDAWNQTKCNYPDLRVDQLFEQRAVEMPNYPAVSFDGRSLTYATLSEETNHLAARLKAIGVGPGSLVGICMDRCSEMVVALLAVFKAGGAYLPLDPALPADRIAFMLADASPSVIITQSQLCQRFSFTGAHVLSIDSEEAEANPECEERNLSSVGSSLDDLAYVLYTSGSTGNPKGVEISHRALVNLLTSVAPALPLEQHDVVLATSTISFDISVFEIFAPLISGAKLVVAPRSVVVSGELLAEAVRTSGATVLQATPSGWRVLLEAGWKGQPGLKMLAAGEPLDRSLAARLLERGSSLWNFYGPTEATIYATGCLIDPDDGEITVGRPLANYTAYVLDHNRKRVPVGALGELYLGGVGIARGYLNRPELTKEKFVADSFTCHPGGRLYRTGDLARFLPSGEIELLGRADNQIKLRGYRIELEEIERVLDSHPDVRKAVVKAIDVSEGDRRLVAYVVPQDSRRIDEAHVREYAQRYLPWYMVPCAYVVLEAFVLTPNGKIDRKALPAPPLLTSHDTDFLSEPVADDLELAVLACWRSTLNIPNLDLDRDFFEVGGHSLLAVRLFSQVAETLGQTLPVSMLLEAPTPRLCASRIRKLQQTPVKCLVPMQTTGTLPPLYLVHHILGDVLIYRALADQFAAERRVFGIQPRADLTKRPRPYTLETIASEYVSEILKEQKEGPFHLAGFSSGSVIAFEMARQLTRGGHQVGMLAFLDGDIKMPGGVISKPAKYLRIAVRKLCKIVFKFRDEVCEGPKQFATKRLRHLALSRQIRHLKTSSGPTESELTIEQTLTLAEDAYRPQPYTGSAFLLRFHDEAWNCGPDPLMGWGGLIQGGIEVADFPGGHIRGMSPAAAPQLASVLKARILDTETAFYRKRRSARMRGAK